MSGRSISRFALAGLLAAAFAAPAAAQEGGFQVPLNLGPIIPVQPALPEAPMPRAKATEIEIEFSFGDLRVKVLETRTGGFDFGPAAGIDLAVAPMPREVAQGPCCGADCCRKSAAAPANVPGCTQLLRDDVYMLAKTMPQPVPPQYVMAPPAPSCPVPGCTTGGLGVWQPVPCAFPPAVPQRQLFTFGDSTRIQVVVADELMCPPCPLPQIAVNPLLGTWYRDTGVGVVAATFTHDELKLCMTQRADGATVAFTLTAHYTMTKDGLVYGAITGADVDAKQLDGKGEVGMELAELSLKLQELTDCPFSFRTKMTSAGLMVSHLKFASTEQFRGSELAILGGVYKSAKDGVVPAPKPIGRTGRTDCQPPLVEVPVQTLPYPPAPAGPTMSEPIQRVGIDFSVNPPLVQGLHGNDIYTTNPPKVSVTVPPCNDAMKGMAADAFGQLLKQSPSTVISGMTLPSGRYLEHYPQYFAPDPSFPLPRELTSNEDPAGVVRRGPVAPVKPGHVGTWVRMIGSKQCVVKIEAEHLTFTASEAHELGEKTVIGHLTITADYHTTRDGLTVVGLITGVDMKFDGELPDDAEDGMLEKVSEMQKAMEEKPFAMTFRRYGETLVIGNLRLPEIGDHFDTPPGAYIGGRYTNAGDKPLPKLKATKLPEPKAPPAYVLPPGLPGTPGTIGVPVPGYDPYGAPLSPPVVKGQLLPPPAVPRPTVPQFVVPAGVGGQRVIVEESLLLPPAVVPTSPAMPMPQPTPPVPPMTPPKVFVDGLGWLPLAPLSQTPKNDSDTKQLFNFALGLFGNQ